MSKRPFKVWMYIDVELMERTIGHMRSLVPPGHERARRERADADQLAADAETLRAELQKSLKDDRFPPPREPPKD